ncbi:MAG: transglycosylase domain-containing protein [Lachnospiraceae bacterium]|nr:transglycosylase domain-containing protein [Lachnospiraceae bacterium]
MKKKHWIRKIIGIMFLLLLCAGVTAVTFFGVKGYRMYQEALAQKSMEERVAEIRNDKDFITYDEMSEFYIDAVISVEDHRFMNHGGIDPIAICRAVFNDIKAGRFKEGGSTITQQIAKNMLFTQEKKMERKAAEVFAALDIEKLYSKEEIFELYVNTAYFGSGHYGIGEAAAGYFDKSPSELTDYESAMLAGVPNAPSAYSPDVNAELAARRAEQVLGSMVDNELITQTESEGIQEVSAN